MTESTACCWLKSAATEDGFASARIVAARSAEETPVVVPCLPPSPSHIRPCQFGGATSTNLSHAGKMMFLKHVTGASMQMPSDEELREVRCHVQKSTTFD